MRRYEAVTGERLHWGLGYHRVDMGSSLMWDGGESRHEDALRLRLDDGTTVHLLYPSWSWMGWTGRVYAKHASMGDDSAHKQLEIDFYKAMSDGTLQRLCSGIYSEHGDDSDVKHPRLTQPVLRSWKGSTSLNGPLPVWQCHSDLIQSVIPAQTNVNGLPSVYDTGRLVFQTSCTGAKTWSVQDPMAARIDLHLQMPHGVISSNPRPSDGPDIPFIGFQMLENTSRRVFGDAHATRPPLGNATSRSLSYAVVSEQAREEYRAKGVPLPALLNTLIVEWVDERKSIAR